MFVVSQDRVLQMLYFCYLAGSCATDVIFLLFGRIVCYRCNIFVVSQDRVLQM